MRTYLAIVANAVAAIAVTGCDNSTSDSSQAVPEKTEALPKKQTPPSASAKAPVAAAGKGTIPSDVVYSVIKTDRRPGIKRTLEIRINKIVSEDVLRTIALKLKAEDSGTYERTFMLYFLPDMTPGSGAWASTHFEPDLKVKILGFTQEQQKAVVAAPPANTDVVGRWVDNAPGFSSQMTIYRKSGTLMMDRKFQDGSSMTITLIEKVTSDGKRFDDAEGSDHGDYFLLTSSGDLEMRNPRGLVATAKPAK